MGNFKEDVAKVEAFVFDVDGVFTDGGIIPLPDGDFLRKYYAKDGYAIAHAARKGYKICIITGGRGAMLEARFRYLKVTELYTNCGNKIEALKEIISKHGFNPRHVLFMGDDIPDLECMQYVGIPVCPADAASEVIEASRYVSEFPGGKGCVRDMVEQVLRARGDWATDSLGVNCVSA